MLLTDPKFLISELREIFFFSTLTPSCSLSASATCEAVTEPKSLSFEPALALIITFFPFTVSAAPQLRY